MIWNYIIYIILASFIVVMSYYFMVDFKNSMPSKYQQSWNGIKSHFKYICSHEDLFRMYRAYINTLPKSCVKPKF